MKYRVAKEVNTFTHEQLIAEDMFYDCILRQLAAYAAPPFDGQRYAVKVFEKMLQVFQGIML